MATGAFNEYAIPVGAASGAISGGIAGAISGFLQDPCASASDTAEREVKRMYGIPYDSYIDRRPYMNIRKTWNLWRLLVIPGGFFIFLHIVLKLQGAWWIMIFLWVIGASWYLILKCKCPKCKRRLLRYTELPDFPWFYWFSNVKIKCIYCGHLLNDNGDDNLDPIRINNGALQSRLIYKVDPVYPRFAKSSGISGTVIINVITNEEGTVVEAMKVSGNPILAEAAEIAMRQWRYSSTLINGKPVPVESNVCLDFLSDGTVHIKSNE